MTVDLVKVELEKDNKITNGIKNVIIIKRFPNTNENPLRQIALIITAKIFFF